MAVLARAIFSWSAVTTFSFSVRSKLSHRLSGPAALRRLGLRSGFGPTGRPAPKPPGQAGDAANRNFPSRRVGPPRARLAASASSTARTRGGRGPAVLDQASAGGPVPPVVVSPLSPGGGRAPALRCLFAPALGRVLG